MNARSVLALIPARGGSKSVPRKNVLPIAGRPLIAYSIDQALQSAYVTRTIVSTDDEEIAEIASHAGAEVPFLRPPQLATDTATVAYALDKLLSRSLRGMFDGTSTVPLRWDGPGVVLGAGLFEESASGASNMASVKFTWSWYH